MEGLMRTWVSLLERAARNLKGYFLNSPERPPLIFAASLRTFHLWFLFSLKSLSHVVALFCCGNLSLWPPGTHPKFQETEANWEKR